MKKNLRKVWYVWRDTGSAGFVSVRASRGMLVVGICGRLCCLRQHGQQQRKSWQRKIQSWNSDFSSSLPPILIWVLFNKSFSVAWKEHSSGNPLSCKSFIKKENTRSSEFNWIKPTLLFLEGLFGCRIQGFVLSVDSLCACVRNYWKNKKIKQQINQASQTVVVTSPSAMGKWQGDTALSSSSLECSLASFLSLNALCLIMLSFLCLVQDHSKRRDAWQVSI